VKWKKRDYNLNTIVTETTDFGEMPLDVYQKLSNDRILFICDTLNDTVATDIVSTLFLKNAEDPTKKITLFINSSGGDIRNALMICDMIDILECPVETVCIGAAYDEAVIILASGTPGLRFATKNAIISTSQLSHDFMTHANLTDAKKYLELAKADNKRMMEILAKTSGKTLKQVNADFERQVFFTSQQAVKYGLIDKVVQVSK
jgi:ATP-dependent Clp protease protease subunit